MSDQEQQKARMESLVKYVEGLLSKKEIEEAFEVGVKEGFFASQDPERYLMFEYKRGKYTYQISRENTMLLEQKRSQEALQKKSQNQVILNNILNWKEKRGRNRGELKKV